MTVISRFRNSNPVYVQGDNSIVVATDTCKNTVYCVAAKNNFKSIEEFGILLGEHFLTQYPTIVKSVNIEILQDIWERLNGVDSFGQPSPHNHAFQRVGPHKHFTHVTATQKFCPRSHRKLAPSFIIRSGLRSFEIMKTAQSGFSNFHRDRFTSLGATDDRLLGTSLTANWLYKSEVNAKGMDYNAARDAVQTALVQTFAGPADKGVFSPSVQQTLYLMVF